MKENLKIIKRSGKRVPFNSNNVYLAIKGGFSDFESKYTANDIKLIFDDVCKTLDEISENQSTVSVERIQNLIESSLETNNYNEVKTAFSNYRERRAKSREIFTNQQRKLTKVVENLTKDSSRAGEKRENANIDGDSAMGTMLQFGSALSKEFAKSYMMDERFANAQDSGAIHIHDLDFYGAGCTTTCTQIPLNKLFEHGFNTGHGFLRPPKGIASYSALACIAIQSNQNDQHGGQSIPLFDYYMAPGVLQTYKKTLKQEIYDTFDTLDALEHLDVDRMDKVVDSLNTIDHLIDILYLVIVPGVFEDENIRLKRSIAKARARALKKTDRTTYQAMEAFIHNLNTMHCLPGSEKIWVLYNNKLSLMSMEEISDSFKPNKYQVISLNQKTGKAEFKYITNIKASGRNRKIYEITSITGQKIRLTDNHKMMSIVDGKIGEEYPKDIQSILSPRGIKFPIALNDINIEQYGDVYKNTRYMDTHVFISEDLAELFGIYCGDGSITGNEDTLTLTVCDKFSEEYLVSLVKHAFGCDFSHRVHYYQKDNHPVVKEYCFNIGVRLGRMFKDICGHGATNKTVPTQILFSNDDIKMAFLKGYFSTDGIKDVSYNESSSISENLSKFIQIMICSMNELPSMKEYLNDYDNVSYKTGLGYRSCKALGIPVSGEVAFEIPKYDLSFTRELFDTKLPRRKNGAVRYSELEDILEENKKFEYVKNLFNVPVKEKAVYSLDEETYDISVEGNETFLTKDMIYVHNSRAGAQVPFSSINFGTDVSPEGRMVSRNFLLAENAGLGNGETPIFPISIFKVKDGVNYRPGNRNYDLLELSCKVTAKRLFPNFLFLDAPYNLQYYQAGNPESEVATMGCVVGDEYITYKIGNKLYVENFRTAYQRVKDEFGESTSGNSKYVDTDKRVCIYDTNSRGFVNCKKFIHNPNEKNWMRLVTKNGRVLYATKNHPLPVFGKGRTFVENIKEGDLIPVTYNQYSEQTINFDTDLAWLLGLILCDGCYDSNIVISLGKDENDIIDKIISLEDKLDYKTNVKEQIRDSKGNYYDVTLNFGTKQSSFKNILNECFGGKTKSSRSIPSDVFSWNDDAKAAFLAGMMDADGYVSIHTNGSGLKPSRFQIGSTNHSLALGQMLLAQSIGLRSKVFLNHYDSKNLDKIRFRIESPTTDFVVNFMSSNKKKDKFKAHYPAAFTTGEYAEVESIDEIVLDETSYDVETDSDRFDVSGILSHNCRTRVMGNVVDKKKEITPGRGNLSFTTINLVRIGIKHGIVTNDKPDFDGFYKELDELMDLVRDQLLQRYYYQCKKHVRNFPFLMGNGVWIDSDKLDIDDDLRKVLKHGSLSIGFIGLAECLKALIGQHHGESDEAQKMGLEIIGHMRDRTDAYAEKYHLNFTLLGTPSEGTAGKYVKIDREMFGNIPGVTDREYYTNSNHIPVYYNISVREKLEKEGPYHALTNAGHIAYIELDGLTSSNPDAIMQVVKIMHDVNIGYGAINHPVDRDPVCGYTGIIGDVCPRCGRHEGEGVSLETLRKLGVLGEYKVPYTNEDEDPDRVQHKLD